MDQETRWLTRYNEVKEFIEREHRNPSKYKLEEHDMLNWIKANRKRMNAGSLKAERLEMFKRLLDLISICNNMRDNKSEVTKKLVLEFLDFLKYKVENDLLTMNDVDSIAKAIKQDLKIVATSDDMAAFYGQSNGNVRSLISRRMIQKPQRRVYYSFNAFSKIVPDKWKK